MAENLTPTVLVKKFRENMNNNGTLKSLFSSQLLPKFEMSELQGMIKSIEREIESRKEAEVEVLRRKLEEMGYEVHKK